MRFLIFIILTLPTFAQGEVLRRNHGKPAPEQLSLSKSFFREEEVKGSCSERRCETVNMPITRQVCADQSNFKYVCQTQNSCTKQGVRLVCLPKTTCSYQWVKERKCENKTTVEPRNICHNEKFECLKKVQVLDHKWEVQLHLLFDPRATLGKRQDEKFEITLDGDEREPKISVQVKRSPYQYTTDYSFANPNEANLELRLDETKNR